MRYLMDYKLDDTVAGQIRALLTTPKGSLPLDKDYGMDMSFIDTDVGYAIDIAELKIEIRDLLVKYVPRMNSADAKIEVKYNSHTGHLVIDIDGITINLAEHPHVPRVATA